jgi:outer membrane protein OmpA-like peptidoglycan-associated protein/tetratricopeptide (TPR) repeat protein
MKNKLILLIIISCLLSTFQLTAQIKQANSLFQQFRYSKAIPLYKKAAENKNEKIREEATVRLADCYRLINNVNEARSWYARAVTYKNVDSINYFYLGMALRALANYDEAEKAFLTFVKKAPDDIRGKAYANFCRNIKKWDGLVPSAEIKNDISLNSPYSDFGPVFYKDGLMFTSDRDIDMIGDKNYQWTNYGYLDLYLAQPGFYNDFWNEMASPLKLGTTFNQLYHDGPASFTASYNTIFTTRTLKNSTKRDSTNMRTNLLKIFYANLNNEKKVDYIAFPYNSEDYSVGHPAISADGKKLIFSSNKPGGYGESDLYQSEMIDGKWTEPANLGPEVNSFGNEVFPFLSNDSTLFFASDGHLGFGGLDIYETNLVDKQWIEPWNLKLPINSPYDDFSIVFDKAMTNGFFSSNRPGGLGSDDIYAFRNYHKTPSNDYRPALSARNKSQKFHTISGFVKDKTTKAPLDSATVFVLNTTTNEVLVLRTNQDGYFETPIATGDLYIAKAMKPDFFDDCLNFRIAPDNEMEKHQIPRDLLLDKYALNQVFVIENIYYDLDKWFIREDAKPPLDNLVRILKQYPINVELGSHTDSRASFEYNIELSQKRAEAAVRYLTLSGINSMRLTAKGYGETKLVNKCSDGVICTEAEHQANRRTEFKITAIDFNNSNNKTFSPNVFKAGEKIPLQLLDSEFFNGCLNNKSTADIGSSSSKSEFKKNVADTPEVNKKPITSETISLEEVKSEKVLYSVQLAAATKPIKNVAAIFKGVQFIHEKKIGVYFKYYSGSFDHLSQALAAKNKLKVKFPEAFVVAFKGDQLIPMNQIPKN